MMYTVIMTMISFTISTLLFKVVWYGLTTIIKHIQNMEVRSRISSYKK